VPGLAGGDASLALADLPAAVLAQHFDGVPIQRDGPGAGGRLGFALDDLVSGGGAVAQDEQQSWSRSTSVQRSPEASPRRGPRRAISHHRANSESSTTAVRNVARCSTCRPVVGRAAPRRHGNRRSAANSGRVHPRRDDHRPQANEARLANPIKPMLDGLVNCFHAHDGSHPDHICPL
jgi:hypothetical protein